MVTQRGKGRQNNGQGTKPYEQADGRWRSELVVDWTFEGKPKKKIIYGKTQKECADNLLAVIVENATTGTTTGPSMRLGDWLKHWLVEISRPRVGDLTNLGYKSKVRLYMLEHRSARIRLNKLTPSNVESIYTAMRKKGLSETTITQAHRILSKALKDAVQRGLITVNPAAKLDAPQPAEYEPDILSVDEARMLITAAEADIENGGARWLLGLSLGPRQGEVLGMGWDQIDLEAGTIRFTRELYRLPWEHGCVEGEKEPTCGRRKASCPKRREGGLFIGTPKSDAGKRTNALPPPLIKALRAHREIQRRYAREDGGTPLWKPQNGKELDLVFRQRNGRPIGGPMDYRRWHAFLKSCGVAPNRVHDARHTAATILLLMGVDGRVVMDMLGWSQASMLKRYQHVIDAMKQDAAHKMASALWTPPEAPKPEATVVSLDAFRERKNA